MMSDLLPHLAALADELCFVHSMTARSNTHGPAENQMATGFTLDGFPSIGAWTTYALGSENANLPAFVAVPDPRGVPQIGQRQWVAPGFCLPFFKGPRSAPTARSPTSPGRPHSTPTPMPRPAILVRRLNERHRAAHPGDSELAARIASYELAARMQLAAPEVADLFGRVLPPRSRSTARMTEEFPEGPIREKSPARPPAARTRRALCSALQRLLCHG